MVRPVLVVVDKDPEPLAFVGNELYKRYGEDYDVICDPSAESALSALQTLKDEQRFVALIFSDQWLPEMLGVEFLNRAHDLHPEAKRILLADLWDREVSD